MTNYINFKVNQSTNPFDQNEYLISSSLPQNFHADLYPNDDSDYDSSSEAPFEFNQFEVFKTKYSLPCWQNKDEEFERFPCTITNDRKPEVSFSPKLPKGLRKILIQEEDSSDESLSELGDLIENSSGLSSNQISYNFDESDEDVNVKFENDPPLNLLISVEEELVTSTDTKITPYN